MELLNKYEYDIIYLDPAYNQRQYAQIIICLKNCQIWQSCIKGISGMRNVR